jgi:hypothetical protein
MESHVRLYRKDARYFESKECLGLCTTPRIHRLQSWVICIFCSLVSAQYGMTVAASSWPAGDVSTAISLRRLPFLSCIPSWGLYINIDYTTLPSLLCVHLKYDNTPPHSVGTCFAPTLCIQSLTHLLLTSSCSGGRTLLALRLRACRKQRVVW